MRAFLRTIGAPLAATMAAILASACCSVPLLAVAAVLGVGGSQLTVLTSLKPYLIAASVVLLGYGFYRAYRYRDCCGDSSTSSDVSESAACPSRIFSSTWAQKISWIAAVIVAASIALPYMQNFRTGIEVSTSSHSLPDATFAVPELKSECCTGAVQFALKDVPGLERAEADIHTHQLSVWFDSKKTDTEMILKALNDSPYKASLLNK